MEGRRRLWVGGTAVLLLSRRACIFPFPWKGGLLHNLFNQYFPRDK